MTIPKFLQGSDSISVSGAKIIAEIGIGGFKIRFTETILLEWLVIAVILGVCRYLTRDLKVKGISKRQVIAEMAVGAINDLVHSTMGKRWMWIAPYIGTVFCFSLFGSLLGLFGLRAVTSDFSVLLTWAVITFVLITGTKIRYGGVGGYLKGLLDPMPVMLPMNILSEFSTPVSMAFRHFGNIAGGTVITALLYYGLSSLSHMIGLQIPLLTIGIPAVLSVYFDLFSDFMQAFIFIMLTMVFISNAGPAEDEA